MTTSGQAFVALADYEAAALSRLEPPVAAYLFGGSADEVTLRASAANDRAFQPTDRSHEGRSCTNVPLRTSPPHKWAVRNL